MSRTAQVTQAQALDLYLALPSGRRTLPALTEAIAQAHGATIAMCTLVRWRKAGEWDRLAAEQDARSRDLVIQANAGRAAADAQVRAEQMETIVDDALTRLRESLPGVLIETTDDLLRLAKLIVELQTRADVMRGGVSDRTEHREARATVDLNELLSRYEGGTAA